MESRWSPDGVQIDLWSPSGVHLDSVGECKVQEISQKETELTSSFLRFVALSLFSECISSNFLKYVLLYGHWRRTSNTRTFY